MATTFCFKAFTVSQVVHDYGDICQAITELAVELDAPISTDDFRTLNRCLDDAIAGAVTEYGRERNQSGIDGESARGSERLGFFVHEMRNLISTASYAFEVLKTGNVALGQHGDGASARHRRAAHADRPLADRNSSNAKASRIGRHSSWPDSSRRWRQVPCWRPTTGESG
jgi:hypothetical protein